MAQMKLKEIFKVQNVHKAFYTGGEVDWTSDGSEILCQCGSNIQILNVENGTISYTIGQELANDEEEDLILTFCLNNDDEKVVTVHKSGLFKEWNLKEKKIVKMWKSIHKGPVACLSLANDSMLLASGGSDSSVRVWDMAHHACTHNLIGIQGVVSVLVFHENSKGETQVFAAADDTTIKVWDLKSSEVVMTFPGHYSTVTGIGFHPGNKHFISCSRDKVIILWDLEEGKQLFTIPVYESLESLVMLPEKISIPGHERLKGGVYVAVAGEKGIISIWDALHKTKLFSQTQSKVVGSEDGCLAVTKLLFNSTKKTNSCCIS
uniref:Uncharacterized protein n=1 Tax=Clastoptera arizonana TaxID=38151 RepID=A0A1B6CEK7_9HEMI